MIFDGFIGWPSIYVLAESMTRVAQTVAYLEKSNVTIGSHENIRTANRYRNTSRFRVQFKQITGTTGGHSP